MSNRNMPLRYNVNPGIKADTGRTTPLVRTDIMGVADQLGVSPFRGDVLTVEYNGETDYDGFTIHNSNVDANRNGVLVDPIAAGTYSGQGQNAITVENEGGRNGARGPGFAQLDLRAGYRLRPGAGRTLDFLLEVFNATNRANFANPTGDMRSANFLIPTTLAGGGFPRQLQLGMRLGF